MSSQRIVAVGLLTQRDLGRFGSALKRVFPVHETPCFAQLLRLIDEAHREHWRAADRKEALRKLREEKP